MNKPINTVTGTLAPAQLGRTLIHEHVFVEYGRTSFAHCLPSGRKLNAIAARCAGFGDGINKYGVSTVVDPTTVDLGRNPLLLAEVAARTAATIICAAGIYSTGAYLKIRRGLGGSHEAVSDLFIKELTEGIDDTGIKAGIIKVVTAHPAGWIEEERELLLAAARASVATGAPIITTREALGIERKDILHGGCGSRSTASSSATAVFRVILTTTVASYAAAPMWLLIASGCRTCPMKRARPPFQKLLDAG